MAALAAPLADSSTFSKLQRWQQMEGKEQPAVATPAGPGHNQQKRGRKEIARHGSYRSSCQEEDGRNRPWRPGEKERREDR